MGADILENPQKVCRTCLRDENSQVNKLQSVFCKDPAMDGKTTYLDMLNSLSNKEVRNFSC